MVRDERLIRPPIEQITSGRVFQPTNAFIGKKLLKSTIIVFLLWCMILIIFIGLNLPEIGYILRTVWQPIEILDLIGWELANLIFFYAVFIIFVIGTFYVIIYVKRIDYSVLGLEGDALPEIYTKRGILTITKKHVPFRTITHVQTRRGLFDRIMGIGTVQIETAGGAVGSQAAGLIGLLIQRVGADSKSEERVEGIKFHEELRDYILREMREIGSSPSSHEQTERVIHKKRIFTNQTLEAFKEVRDALKASQETTGGE